MQQRTLQNDAKISNKIRRGSLLSTCERISWQTLLREGRSNTHTFTHTHSLRHASTEAMLSSLLSDPSGSPFFLYCGLDSLPLSTSQSEALAACLRRFSRVSPPASPEGLPGSRVLPLAGSECHLFGYRHLHSPACMEQHL